MIIIIFIQLDRELIALSITFIKIYWGLHLILKIFVNRYVICFFIIILKHEQRLISNDYISMKLYF